jgi:asparagine synthase (glutamine-hydrolysing)
MFRYIALLWDHTIERHAAIADRLGDGLEARPGWQAALLAPGLRVFTAGARQGINGSYPLPAQGGVIVGKLFRRGDIDATGSNDVEFTFEEADRIRHTGGRSLVEGFWGRYVAFFCDAANRSIVIRDPSGTLPCYRMQHEGVWIVFSWLDDVLSAMPCVRTPAINWEGIEAHILLGLLGGRETALCGVWQVLPGECTLLTPTGAACALAWNAVDIARAAEDRSPEEAATRLRHTVRACAQAWANCYDRILLRLSGGVDSAILLSCLDRGVTSAEVVCLNYHSAGSDSDERTYARLAAVRAGRTLIERERDDSFRLEALIDVARTPTPGHYVGRMGASRMDAELAAAHGASAMFTGGGGDQLFFELRCTWPAADYLKNRGLGIGFAAAAMDAARLGRVSLWQAIRSAVADCLRPPDPWQGIGSHLRLAGVAALQTSCRRERFIHPALVPNPDLPVGKLHQTQDLTLPFEYYDPCLQDAAPELVNPLLSQPLIELCLRLPTYCLTRGGRGRALARDAFAADIPHEIACRRSKGGMDEHVARVLARNITFARSLLLDGRLVERGILDRRRVEAALSGSPAALSAYVGEVLNCIGVEAWLNRWPATAPALAA